MKINLNKEIMLMGKGRKSGVAFQLKDKSGVPIIVYLFNRFCQGTLSQILAGSPDVPNCLGTPSQIVIISKTVFHAPIL